MDPLLIPPGVCGRIRGTITITIDEVFWSTKSPGDVYVKFAWWGSDERFFEFHPKNSTRSGNEKNEKEPAAAGKTDDLQTTYSWNVGTSWRLLEEYFRRWKCIIFNVYRSADKRLVGTVRMENWNCILTEERYSSYFAIVDRKGDRVGDLRITFALKMKKKKYKLKSDFPIVKNVQTDENQQQPDPLAELLNKGQKLRKAMVKSVLSSCDNNDLDAVVADDVGPVFDDNEEKRQAKLVDYLMGKPLTAPEKEIAVQTLRCSSPAESVVEVAASIGDHLNRQNSAKTKSPESNPKKFCSVDGRRPATIATDRLADVELLGDRRHSGRSGATQPSALSFNGPNGYFTEKPIEQPKLTASSYRVTFEMMTLTAAGLKKVSTSPTIRPLNNKIRPAKSPGIVFSIETVIPFSPNCKAAYLKPLTIPSKAFGGNDVVFNGSVVQKLNRSKDGAWSQINDCICGIPVKIYWRCLNQRLPSLFGQCNFPDEIDSDDFESTFQLPVFTANKMVVATLECSVQLGDSGLFGNQLLGGDTKKRRKPRPEFLQPQVSETVKSRESTGSDKSSRMNGVGQSLPPLSPIATSSTSPKVPPASEKTRESVEADQQLMNAIVSLNEKLSQKSTRPANDEIDNREVESIVECPKNEPTADAGPGRHCQDAEDDTTSPRKANGPCCCHCCHGCHGDNKRKKLPRRRHALRDRKHPVNTRCSRAQNDESTAASNSEANVKFSPPAHHKREMLNDSRSYHQRSRYHHSPPTRLNGESRGDLGYRHKGAGESSRRPHDNGSARDYVKSRNRRHDSDIFQSDFDRINGEPKSGLTGIVNVHRFNVNVYSSDAQIFYREGELELYMAYRFPQVDPVTGKLFCPNQVSCLELSGDASPLTHYLPLRLSLSDALLAYPKHHVTFHIYARAFLYEKRDFLIGQAKLPLEKFVEWEAAHNYSQKRRAEHPLLPPDKFFINLRIQPSKGELPQHLEPGRIAQLGLEIDYEKFQDGSQGSPNAWQFDPPLTRPYCEPSHALREEIITDSSELYTNSKRDLGHDSVRWAQQDNRGLQGGQNVDGKWGLRVVDSFSDPADLSAMDPSRVEGNRRPGQHKVGNGELRSADLNDADANNEEFMLILDNQHHDDPFFHSSNARSKAGKTDFLERHADANGLWEDNSLQVKSLSRIDPANTTDFVANDDFANVMCSPRVERDFPQGVQVADFSSDDNTNCRRNPFDVPVTMHRQPGDSIRKDTRLGNDSKVSPLPSLARMIDPNYRRTDDIEDVNLDSSYEIGSDSKATQTSVNELKSKDLFSVRIEVEAAINLPQIVKNGEKSKPSSRVEFDAFTKGKEIIVQSSVVKEDSNPRYDSAWNVELPTHLLSKSDSELEIRVVNVENGSVSSAFVDLTTLSAGLPSIDGWFFLSSNGHKSSGQVKVTITPTESIRKYRDEWIEECRKKKHGSSRPKDPDRFSHETAHKMLNNESCTSSKFKEKMKELEQLTERMKQKLLNAERWNESPPCSLMRDVDNFAKNLLREEQNELKTSSIEGIQDMPVLDMSTVREFCPANGSFAPLDRSAPGSSFALNEAPPAFRDRPGDSEPSKIRKPYQRLSREKFRDSNDSIMGGRVSSDQEAGRLPKDSLDAASLAIEKMIAELQNKHLDGPKS